MSAAHPVPSILSSVAPSKTLGGTVGSLTLAPEQARPRRLTATQGRALEILGHAIEYLVDTRLACADEFCSPAAQEAIQLLSRANREVYQSNPTTAPEGNRIMRWLMNNLLG
jgi:hypothetical protein